MKVTLTDFRWQWSLFPEKNQRRCTKITATTSTFDTVYKCLHRKIQLSCHLNIMCFQISVIQSVLTAYIYNVNVWITAILYIIAICACVSYIYDWLYVSMMHHNLIAPKRYRNPTILSFNNDMITFCIIFDAVYREPRTQNNMCIFVKQNHV